MNRASSLVFLALLLGWTPGCDDGDHPHDESGQHVHDDHGAPGEHPTVAVTYWTERSELFLEYPLLVAGESGRSAVHVTKLDDFSPLSEGEVIFELRGADGEVVEFRNGPSRPGVFGVDLRVERPGLYDVTLRIDAPHLEDVHDVGRLRVYAREDSLPGRGEEEEGISFLKEQQWTLDFGTVAAAERGIRSGVLVPASLQPWPGRDALLTAPVPGRTGSSADVPVPGTRVRAGAVLVRIEPRSDDLRDAAGLRASLVEAEQEHGLALQERDRAQRLVEVRALPERRLQEAEAELVAAAARLEAARERWTRFESLSQSSGSGDGRSVFALRAPFDGVVSEVRFTAGVAVEADEPLLRVVDPDRVHVVGTVPEMLAPALEEVSAGELVLEGRSTLDLGRPLAISPVIDPIARTAEIRFGLDNGDARFRVGQSVRLRLLVGGEAIRTAIPESAVVEDGGRSVVFVQTAGESFERRPVRLGDAADGWIHVIEGVDIGERVVHRGAYLIRLAAMSTQIPAHGHVH